MGPLTRQQWPMASVLLVPCLTLAAPGFLRLAGVGPAWAVLWLLPWALVDGPVSGMVAGAAAGLLLDALHPAGVSQWPALLLLGFWWGRMGRRGPPIERSFSLGLLAMLGSLLLDLSLMLQWLLASLQVRADGLISPGGIDAFRLAQPGWQAADLAQAGLHVLLARVLLTGLLAPVLCSLQLVFWRQLCGGSLRR